MYEEAVRLNLRALEIRRELNGEEDPETIEAMHSLGNLYLDMPERRAESLPLLEQAFALRRRVLGNGHARTLSTMQNLVHSYRYNGQHEKAIALGDELVALCIESLGRDAIATLNAMMACGAAYRDAEREDAVRHYDEAVKVGIEFHPDEHSTHAAMALLAVMHRDGGRLEDGIQVLEQAVELGRRFLPSHYITSENMELLGGLYLRAGRVDEAIALAEQSLAANREIYGTDHAQSHRTRINLAHAYLQLGRLDRAVEMLTALLPFVHQYPQVMDNAPPRVVMAAELLAAQGLADRAKTLLAPLFEIMKDGEPDDIKKLMDFCLRENPYDPVRDWKSYHGRSILGGVLVELAQDAWAEPWLVVGLDGLRERDAEIPADMRDRILDEALERLVALYERRNAPGDPEKAAARKAERRQKN